METAQLLGLRPQLGARLSVRRTTRRRCLPRGTILRVTGYYDNTAGQPERRRSAQLVRPRHRSIDNMNIMIMQGVSLTDEQFQAKSRRGGSS
jgi:hypothetical protein